ncbi:MAG TPA: M1 family metallopeptidase [Steroidobacteraceae bacterium]|nr:M1 family metallopeptidase [Steroidobacteraceae bacterium]
MLPLTNSRLAFLLAALPLSNAMAQTTTAPYDTTRDYHSYSNPRAMRVEHVDLDLDVDFKTKTLGGTVDLVVHRLDEAARDLALDTRDLTIQKISLLGEGGKLTPLTFRLDARDPVLGSALHVAIPADVAAPTFTVRIAYRSQPSASGLQWLTPAQTAGKKYPFLFSQSEAIHARSWIPLQDSPQVRVTYRAHIRTPRELRAVMSAGNQPESALNGDYRFEMPQAIPSYLIALAVGDLQFRSIGARTGVFAEPLTLAAAANEFAETESMLETCEKLFGPYRWTRYDLLILPPSFPYGGMENPRLSFITPTVIAGDRSLVSLITHEMAHSWSGNLVTNATWRDFWLNEGFTVFLERRILDSLYGQARHDMEAVHGLQDLNQDLSTLEPRDQVLAIDLRGRDPDDAFSNIPYEKGYLFLKLLESKVGTERFDAFLRGYFDHFAFQSITTEQFVEYLKANLLDSAPQAVNEADLTAWLHQPGLPENAVLPHSDAFLKVDEERRAWLEGRKAARDLPGATWSTYEWLHFLDNMPASVTQAQLAELDRAFKLTQAGNAEIAHSWFMLVIRNHYQPALARLDQYLLTIGRLKLIKPLYKELMKSNWGAAEARRVYADARAGYHPITTKSLDEVVLKKAAATSAATN